MQYYFWRCTRHYFGKYPRQNDGHNWLTRVHNSFQQEYYMCEETYLLFLQEHGFLKTDTILSYGGVLAMCKQHSHLTWFSRNIALMHWILHFLTWILHTKKVAVNWTARYIWQRNIAYLYFKGYHIIWKKIAFLKTYAASFRGFPHKFVGVLLVEKKHCTFPI